MATEKQAQKRKITGEVISNKMDKTIVVRVDNAKMHPRYHKQYADSKNYKVHDEKNEAKIGQTVVIEEARPLSKDKRWRLVEIKK